MNGRWISHDVVEVPMSAIDEKTGTIGDGLVKLGPDDERFAFWAEWLVAKGHRRPEPTD